MKFIHLSDLHLGKRVNEFSMLEDQRYILSQIIKIMDDEKPDAVLIAGDVYDKSVPAEEAMVLWNEFLNKLVKRAIKVFAISGNHDSAVRFSTYNELVEPAGIYLAPSYDGHVKSLCVKDEYGEVNIYMLPFIKPVNVRAYFPDEQIANYTDALKVVIKDMNIDPNKRNLLMAHQFVTGAQRSESEEINVGGLDNVDASVFDDFDYVALGHIHGKQSIKRECVRYCGTPLKYSFSERKHQKSVTIIEMGPKNELTIREKELIPLRDMRQIRGTYLEVTSKDFYKGTEVKDYIEAVLTDEEDVPDAMAKLRIIYPNIMKLSYDNQRTRENRSFSEVEEVERKTPLEHFEDLFELQNNVEMSEEQKEFVRQLIEKIWED